MKNVMMAIPAVQQRSIRTRTMALLAATTLAGCTVGPHFDRPVAPRVTGYDAAPVAKSTVAADGAEQRLVDGAKVVATWWTLFGSDPLNSAMTEALAGNPGLEQARASLSESRDNLRAGYGIFYPQIDGGLSAERQQSSYQRLGQDLPATVFNLFTLSASVSYVLDVFGGEHRTVEQLAANVDAQEATVNATYLTLSANVANTLIAIAAYRAEINALNALIDREAQQVKLAKVQASAGTATYVAALSLQAQLAASEASIPPLAQKLSQAEHLLATLRGKLPAEATPLSVDFASLMLPTDLPVSIPSDLVRQRPDILVAEANLHAASAGIGIATAALLPSISLNASYGANGQTVGTLFAQNGQAWAVGASATTPLFHGGELWFKRKAAIEVYREASANYRQTVLSAFAQVADVLRALEHDAQALAAQNNAVLTADRALHLVQANYQAGLGTYADVLLADGQYQQALMADVEARAVRYQDTVALFVAMGGGLGT